MLFFLKLDTLSQVEEESLLRNDLRPANKLAKGNRLFMRFATKGKCDSWHSFNQSHLFFSDILLF